MTRTSRPFLKLFITLAVIGLMGLIYLDARITATFIDKMWELPAKVYARPLELFEGAKLKPDDLAYELEVLGYGHVGVTTVCPSYVSTGLFEGAKPPRTTRFVTPEKLSALNRLAPAEMEINPVLAFPDTAVAVDMRLRVDPEVAERRKQNR